MTKAKATKLDKEIQEGLYDPKMTKIGEKYIIEAAPYEAHRRGKNYGSQIKGLDPKYIFSRVFLNKGGEHGQYILPEKPKAGDIFELKAIYRSGSGSPSPNADSGFYELQTDGTFLKISESAVKNRFKIVLEETFDPKKPATIYVITDAKGNKKKVGYAEWLKWMKEQKKLYDPKRKVSSLPPIRWYEAMVRGIKKSSDVRNPYAIVKSIWAKLSPSKRSEIKAREAKGERFKYDLPLPVDKPTRGTGTVRMVKPFKLAEVQVNMSVKDYLIARASGLFQRMKRQDGTTALVARCKSPEKNVNMFIDKVGGK